MIFCTQFSAQKAGNCILGHWCTPPVPSRRRGVKASFWYSQLHFSNLLATSIFIETPGSLQEIATLAIILEISDSNLETGRYNSKSGISLIILVELTSLVLVYHVSGGTEHIYLNKVPPRGAKDLGCTRQSMGGSAPRSNPLAFNVQFLTLNIPLSLTFYWKMVPPSHLASSLLATSPGCMLLCFPIFNCF